MTFSVPFDPSLSLFQVVHSLRFASTRLLSLASLDGICFSIRPFPAYFVRVCFYQHVAHPKIGSRRQGGEALIAELVRAACELPAVALQGMDGRVPRKRVGESARDRN